MAKKYLLNPPLLFVLAGNIYCIWYCQNHPGGFATVVWIYWFQSITIGLFNFIGLMTMKKYDTGNFKLSNNLATDRSNASVAWFFAFHFGFFHAGYAIFLLVIFSGAHISSVALLFGVITFFLESLVRFIQQKQLGSSVKLDIGKMFFLPYLRIIPMHLMILLPAFIGWKPSLLFLCLKMTADIISFLLYERIYSKKTN